MQLGFLNQKEKNNRKLSKKIKKKTSSFIDSNHETMQCLYKPMHNHSKITTTLHNSVA